MTTRWELRQGDALALLGELGDETIDCTITDSPYSSGGFTRGDRMADPRAKYLEHSSSTGKRLANFSGDNRDQRGFAMWCSLWLAELRRASRPGAPIVLFTDWRQLPLFSDCLQAGGFIWRGIVPWAKPNPRPQKGRFAAACEYIVWGSNGPMPAEGPCLRGLFEVGSPRMRDRRHVTEKPVALLRELVAICPSNGLICDPFAGSGTTGVAAIAEGRRFLGFELSDEYASIARQRIKRADDLRAQRIAHELIARQRSTPTP